MIQTCYGGVKYLDGAGPCLPNVDRLDRGAWPMIHYMAQTGLQVDLSHFAKMEKELERDKEEITEQVHQITGYYCNLDSADQVSELLFKKLGLKQPKVKMTKSGDRESVEYEVLVQVQHQHEAVAPIMAFKEVSKLYGTYVRPMPKLARRSKFGEWRMYPKFGTTRIPSGRLNCKEPNLLAMPNRTKRGREVCKGFITRPGWVYLSVDLSQIEPRVIAHRSGDQALTKVYFNGEDLYSDYAINAFSLPDSRFKCNTPELCRIEATKDKYHFNGWHYPGVKKKEQRFPSKTCVLAWFYRVTAQGLVEQMPVICKHCAVEATEHRKISPGCSFQALWQEDNCQQLINAAAFKYTGVVRMWRQDEATARINRMAWDGWGRILHAGGTYSCHEYLVNQTLRELGNFPVQSTAQGPVKLSMAESFDELEACGALGEVVNPLLQVHDELLFEARESDAQEIGQYVIEVMENSVRLRVPLKAEMGTAVTWGDLVK